jgi:hypothetical protein
VVSEEFRENEQTRAAGEKSERLLEDTYLSGAVVFGAGAQVHDDHSWKSHAVEEGDAGDEPAASGGGLRAALRRWFGR